MALPATWIRKNMLQSPSSNYNHHQERQMSENEMRVLRSIQKLSIPEWYLNNNSRPPKILMNDTPIDRRPPNWKSLSVKKTDRCNTPVMPVKNLTVNRNGLLETEIGPSIGTNSTVEPYKINRVSPMKKSPSPQKRDSPTKNCIVEKTTPKAKISQTFPRMSPSRKIQNINIVFPQQSKIASEITTDLERPDSPVIDFDKVDKRLDMTKDSLEVTNFTEQNEEYHEAMNYHDDSADSCSSKRKEFRSPNRHLGYIIPWKPSATQEEVRFGVTPRDKFPVAESFKLRASSTPQGSPVSNFSTFDFGAESIRENRRSSMNATFQILPSSSACTCENENRRSPPIPLFPITDLDEPSDTEGDQPALYSISEFETTKERKLSPPISPRTKKIEVNTKEEIDDLSKMAPSTAKPTPSPRKSIGFRPRNLLRSNPPKNSRPSSPSCMPIANEGDTSGIGLFETTKKSTELESIVKSMQRSRDGHSLVREIIEELNEKCRVSSPHSTHITPGTKNFVKKLVRDLENGIRPVPRDNEEEEKPSNDDMDKYRANQENVFTEEEIFIGSENGSEDDVKSAAASTSISYKDTDSSGSDTEIGSTIKHEYEKYDWNMNVEKNIDETINNNNNNNNKNDKTTPIVKNNEEESVYWVPISRCNLPRTSSLLSMASKWTLNNNKPESPSISPIDMPKDSLKKNYYQRPGSSSTLPISWDTSCKTKRAGSKKLWRIDETTILDSGYSDRSSVRSSRLSYGDDNMIWSDYGETTETASEIGSCYNESIHASNSTNLQSSRAQICGPSRVI